MLVGSNSTDDLGFSFFITERRPACRVILLTAPCIATLMGIGWGPSAAPAGLRSVSFGPLLADRRARAGLRKLHWAPPAARSEPSFAFHLFVQSVTRRRHHIIRSCVHRYVCMPMPYALLRPRTHTKIIPTESGRPLLSMQVRSCGS